MDKIEPGKVDKDNFIQFLTHATPEEMNELIDKKGKPRKPYYPFYEFRAKEESQDERPNTYGTETR